MILPQIGHTRTELNLLTINVYILFAYFKMLFLLLLSAGFVFFFLANIVVGFVELFLLHVFDHLALKLLSHGVLQRSTGALFLIFKPCRDQTTGDFSCSQLILFNVKLVYLQVFLGTFLDL